MGNLREENVMKGKRIVTIYYVIVLALGITSLILIRPEKPPEPLCNFKFNYQGEKFEPTDKLQYLSLIHISEPTRLGMISYAVFCLKKKWTQTKQLICELST